MMAGQPPQTPPLFPPHSVSGLEPIGSICSRLISDLERRHKLKRLHSLGQRATAELVVELAARSGAVDELDDLLQQYLRLSPEMLSATGGDRLPRTPLQVVRSGGQ